jgi:hypothetical protein
MKTANGPRRRPFARRAGRRRDEHVDDVLPALVHERRDRVSVEIIDPAADERKSDRRKIDDRR